MPGDHSEREPPDPISNSEVKPLSADGSVGFPHVRVGHCQAPTASPDRLSDPGFFVWGMDRKVYDEINPRLILIKSYIK